MALRRRVALVSAVAVGIAIVGAAFVCYFVVRGQLRGEVDNELRAQATAVQQGDIQTLNQDLPGIPASAGGPAPYVQAVTPDGNTYPREGGLALPSGAHARGVAAGTSAAYLSDVHVGGSHLRMITFAVPAQVNGEPVAIQLARPLNGVDHILSNLRLVLALLVLFGMGLAAMLGRLAARRVLAPLAEVSQAAQHISETEDLTSRIQVRNDDEVGQLATRFNAMLERLERSRDALDDSVRAQRQLVADASHELRTPVTSLRTNIEVLLAGGELSDEDRHRLLDDVVEQSEELSTLVSDLIDLARGDLPSEAVEDVRLDRVVAECVTRAQRNAPGIEFESELEPRIVDGVPDRLGRAINNLLDNAARHSPPDGTVEVTVDSHGVRVRDHGPGVDPADLPHVFDRFYRGTTSRGKQGSGLGLAIVRQVAEQHHGSVSAENAPDGGAIFCIALPTTPAEGGEPPSGVSGLYSPSIVPGARR
jgi:two-component system, OmpR family, sensor histidine kinase MprB